MKIKKTSIRFDQFPPIQITESGMSFYSIKTHRIKITSKNIFQINKILYIELKNGLICIKNVENVQIFENFLYFKALGNVEIVVDIKNVYNYLVLSVKSKQIDMKSLKQEALLDFINSDFDMAKSELLKKYIKILKKALNINVLKEKIIIKQNKYKIPFVLTYKINNQIKKVCVNETLENL